MATYLFLQRNPETTATEEIARVVYDEQQATWGAGSEAIRRWLALTYFRKLEGVFDETVPEHWHLLPELVSGSRFWVAVKENTA